MNLKILATPLSVIQVPDLTELDLTCSPLFLAYTDDELSVVLPTEKVPAKTINQEDDWRALKIVGVLDFSLVGILAKIATLLAHHDISIFAISTYNTDYILVKKNNFANAIQVLSQNNYTIEK